MEFSKMQGLGNSYVCINCINKTEYEIKKIKEKASLLCNKNLGIGADGVILICKSEIALCKMRIINADGTEARNVRKWNSLYCKIHIRKKAF